MDADQPDQQRGLYPKFDVKRISDTTGKHKDCSYFVLDLNHDQHAARALEAYARACEAEFPKLAYDLRIEAAQVRGRFNMEPPPGTIEEAVRWILNDANYKAPEQIGEVAQRWIDRLRDVVKV